MLSKRALSHNTPENMNRLFGNPNFVSRYVCDKRLAWYGKVISLFVDEAELDFNQKTIADVGCGTGHALKYIHDNYAHGPLYGYDFSSKVIEVAKETLPIGNFVLHDLNDPLDREFDIIIGLEVFEHLVFPDKVLMNIREALRPNGLIFLTIPDGAVDGYFGHINKWTAQEWLEFSGATIAGKVKGGVLWGIIEKKP